MLQDYLFDNAKQRRWDCAMSELTDQSALEVVQDVIREKLCKHTDKELPYVVQQASVVVGVAIDVRTGRWDNRTPYRVQ